MVTISSEYPPDALGGCDFISSAAVRNIEDRNEKGELIMRPERVAITERYVDFEEIVLVGRVCIGEATIRMIASEFGMVDQVTVHRIVTRSTRLQAEVDQLKNENRDLRVALDALRRADASRNEGP